ncbi:uncharacterized protein N7483_008026 [Penicillium malachiteum]|uniref:uncharacterized protein n=1 Tax=Penicillium malachiteum TaxID=1324776 RepID=UPI0025488600|nr:uncharacterized protein N7483_008026 [Penicillium malachiteum]KAJ5726669.1 hypothetical protein N7483_008026 [Penicillium malachiteum]
MPGAVSLCSISNVVATKVEDFSKSRKQRAKLLGGKDEKAIESIAILAEAYSLKGWWKEAEQLQIIAKLASTFWNQGRWEEAKQLQVQVMETRKTNLGADHPNILTSMANLVLTLWR